ncbi:DUF5107 domain-containing protein [Paenibacillus lycopersici]|uniref:DUF5107 domain-containing protein n=1 Tax=Paenibacillus lycopersici TaxID=2704462 RepID=A0A6C0G3P1_9BACL|nr:DUF5107 domain-containing protein [Paenibacillus lycopersici]QHT59385.1 DUF5107 domain-containing protein [Paenibacillus lycopersici]
MNDRSAAGANPLAEQRTACGRERITIPTYAVGAPSLNPIIGEYRQEKPYPYKMQDEIAEVKADKTYEALVAENEYLKLTVLPELGGRLYSAFDKRNGRELFHRNNVIKPQLIGLTGAWIAGGVEFNFPIGHRPTSLETVEAHVRANADGSASIFVGETDKISGLRFSVELKLMPGKAYIEQTTRIYNPTPVPQRFFHWNTASYPDTDSLVCRYPTRWIIDEQNRIRKPWPYDGHVDVRMARNIEKFSSIFSAMNEEDYFGIYDTDKKAGSVHVGDHREVPGSKFWSWGNHEHGKQWNRLLTDDDGPYMEQQAGNTETQYLYHYLQPNQKHQWSEYWLQAIDTGPFTYANKHVVLTTAFQAEAEGWIALQLSLLANERLPGASVSLLHDDAAVFTAAGDWSPERTEQWQAKLPSACLAEGKLRLTIRDGEGSLLADHLIRHAEEAPDQDEEEVHAQEQDDLTTRLVRLYRAEERHRYQETLELLDDLLATHPDYLEAHVRKAVVQLKMLDYAAAEATVEAAAGLIPFSDELHYYTGLVRYMNGKDKNAKSALLYVNDISAFAPSANLLLGKIALKEKEWSRAERYFAKADMAPGIEGADVLRAYALRQRGDLIQAKRLLANILANDPLRLHAAAELDMLTDGNRCRAIVRDDVHNALILAEWYAELADEDGQRFALSLAADAGTSAGVTGGAGSTGSLGGAGSPGGATGLGSAGSPGGASSLGSATGLGSAGSLGGASSLGSATGLGSAGSLGGASSLGGAGSPGGAESPLVLYHAGYLESMSGNAALASRLYEQAEACSPDGVFPILPLTLLALEDAVRLLGDRAVRALYMSGLIYNAKERYADAGRVWARCIELGFDYSVLYRNYGFLLMEAGKDDEAIEVLEQGLEMLPVNQDIAIYLARLYKRSGRSDKRLKLLQALAGPGLGSQSAVRLSIEIYNELGRYDEAIALLGSFPFSNWENPFKGMPDLRTLYHDAFIGRAKQALREKRWDEAIRDLKGSLSYPGNLRLGVEAGQSFAREYYLLALCYEKKGDFMRSLAHCKQAAQSKPAPDHRHYKEYVKAVQKMTELEWLGFGSGCAE